ncbi:MAG: 4Fe-4S binding protein [Calditrichia bacterium]
MILIDEQKCDLCGTCVGVCPENVMGLSITRLTIDHEGCTLCSKCVWVCPVRALELEIPQKTEISENL